MALDRRCIFITGGTGYMGQRLIPRLLARGHEVRALVRPGSEKKLPAGCTPIIGNALVGATYTGQISPADIFVQLVGAAHPSPAKAAEFKRIDLPAGLAAVQAAKTAGVRHFVLRRCMRTSQCGLNARRQSNRPDSMRRFCGPGTCLVPGTAGPIFCCPCTSLLSCCRERVMEPVDSVW